jgi:hypothetical protein
VKYERVSWSLELAEGYLTSHLFLPVHAGGAGPSMPPWMVCDLLATMTRWMDKKKISTCKKKVHGHGLPHAAGQTGGSAARLFRRIGAHKNVRYGTRIV